MSWENEYKSKLTTAEKAVELIKSGNRVVIGHACAEPSYLVDAMVANAESYHDVEIVHMVAMGKPATHNLAWNPTSATTLFSLEEQREKPLRKDAEIIPRAFSTGSRNYLQTAVFLSTLHSSRQLRRMRTET